MNFLFPLTCLHCKEPAKANLCKTCNAQLALLDPPTDAALPYYGPAASILNAMRTHYLPHLAKGCAAILALQFARLNYPKPDLIIPAPTSLIRSFKRGYNPTYLMAKALGKLLSCPVKCALKKRSYHLPQTALSPLQRIQLPSHTIILRKRPKAKTILLIDDLLGTGATFARCRERLLPASIYQLALCKEDF